ncbi:MAG: type II toxin-antitoxin system death-on-curing family toxin [Gammaproteobacteria bacterium]|jgi:death-on-curing protein|nr:type II toxin-antitoxin system death-on-curing family toxin [Gammaproteobacteria bacterium]
MTEPIWVSKNLALAVHARQLSEHGGGDGVRDETLLESALARPQQLASYGEPAPDIAALAAALGYGIACNHPFVDGNKRTAAVATELFIELNGQRLLASNEDMYPIFLSLAKSNLSEAELADWLRLHSQDANTLHETASVYR